MHFLSLDIVRNGRVKHRFFLKQRFQSVRGLICLYALQKESFTVVGQVNQGVVFYQQVA